jgi:hypothetical protein
LNIIRVIKTKRIRGVGRVTSIVENTNAGWVLLRNAKEKDHLCRRKDNIKTDLKVGRDGMD